ncbi:MAG: NAD(P)-dependent oxidoreductase [Litoreibacter sp.]|nr:NAD(P)-dependent oxidoreductase [Litoreibacter sp.]MCY4333172.1 NAD(P)-dependent oxidoreductase [Litoreibacter sp.]
MRLLILGANGKLARLLRASWPKSKEPEPVWLDTPNIDLRSASQALSDAMKGVDAVLNLAGVTRETGTRAFSDNVAIAHTVLSSAAGLPVILCSSAAVYGDRNEVCHEDMPAKPLSPYGRSKLEMEQVAADFEGATCLRISNVAGADALFGHVREHYQLDRFPGGGFPVRSYIGPHHLASVIAKLALLAGAGRSLPKILNVAAETPVRMDALLDEAGKDWTPVPAPLGAIESVHLDISRLAKLLATNSPYPSVLEDLRAVRR